MFRTLRSLLAATLFLALPAMADAPENPDIQSPAEIEAARKVIEHDFANVVRPESLTAQQKEEILSRYAFIDPGHLIATDILSAALVYFDANKDKFPNQNYVSIVDFKPRSDHYRFFVIHMNDGSVEQYHTTHAVGSDPRNTGYATIFGNVINSGISSIGPVRTAETYYGHYKRALRIDGLASSNSNIRARAIVVHGWDNVHEANVIQGLSHGCMTLDWKLKDGVIDEIKEGSLIYVAQSKE